MVAIDQTHVDTTFIDTSSTYPAYQVVVINVSSKATFPLLIESLPYINILFAIEKHKDTLKKYFVQFSKEYLIMRLPVSQLRCI